jgi:hypothetical protein
LEQRCAMSKAFTKESDADEDDEGAPNAPPPLPADA